LEKPKPRRVGKERRLDSGNKRECQTKEEVKGEKRIECEARAKGFMDVILI
jgi:hypothetical protein